MKSAQLLSDLRTMTQQHLVYVLYSDFYLPEIDQAMAKSSSTAVEEFKSGWLGAYFVNAMIPGPESRASKVDLNKVKTGITISKLVRIKLGDILRVVIYHNDRHMEQIKGIRKS